MWKHLKFLPWLFLSIICFSVVFWALIHFIKSVRAEEVTVQLTIQCYAGNYAAMERNFLKHHNEIPLLRGVINGANLMYIFRNKDTDEWTFVYLGIGDYYCIPFYGDGLVPVASKKRKVHVQTY